MKKTTYENLTKVSKRGIDVRFNDNPRAHLIINLSQKAN